MKVKWPIETHEPNTNWAPLVQLTKWAWLSPSSEGSGLYILRTDHGPVSQQVQTCGGTEGSDRTGTYAYP